MINQSLDTFTYSRILTGPETVVINLAEEIQRSTTPLDKQFVLTKSYWFYYPFTY